ELERFHRLRRWGVAADCHELAAVDRHRHDVAADQGEADVVPRVNHPGAFDTPGAQQAAIEGQPLEPLGRGDPPERAVLVEGDTPEYCNKRMRPGRGRGRSCNPCRGAYRCSYSTRGFASLTPRLISYRPPGAEYVTAFMKSCTNSSRSFAYLAPSR